MAEAPYADPHEVEEDTFQDALEYLTRSDDLHNIMHDLVQACLVHRPDDVVKFCIDHFQENFPDDVPGLLA